MAKYIDGFVVIIPKDKEEDYKKMAEEGREVWMRHGALQYFECKGADLETQEFDGDKARTFPEMSGAKADENVWFSFVIYESKKQRDEITAKVHAEMGEKYADYKDFVMPFDTNRMAQGGFQVEIEG
jgi:uncharacterized protein YbaA (DUF1428 family)